MRENDFVSTGARLRPPKWMLVLTLMSFPLCLYGMRHFGMADWAIVLFSVGLAGGLSLIFVVERVDIVFPERMVYVRARLWDRYTLDTRQIPYTECESIAVDEVKDDEGGMNYYVYLVTKCGERILLRSNSNSHNFALALSGRMQLELRLK